MEKSEKAPHFLSQLWQRYAQLGVEQAPAEQRERVRRVNVSVAMYTVFGLFYFAAFIYFGASQLAIFSLVTMTPGPIIVLLNAAAKHRSARVVQTISFPFVIAAVYCSIGIHSGIELLFFPAIASIFVIFTADERSEIRASLVITGFLFVFALKYAHFTAPWFVIDESLLPWMRASFWFVSFALFVLQVSQFFGAIQRSKQELIRSNANTEAILESVDDGFYFVDRNWTLLYANTKAKGFLAFQGVLDGIGQNFWDLAPSETKREFVGKLKSSMETGKPLRYEYYDEQQGKWMELRGDPSVAGMSVSFREISERKSAEQKLLQASKMSSLGEMAGSIAHEINNPLAIIQLSAEQIEMSATDGSLNSDLVAKSSKRILDTVDRVAKIVRGLKSFSRNVDHDPMISTSLRTLIDDSLELCREKFKNRGIELRIGEFSETRLLCRPTEISHVILNLLSNSYDAVEGLGGEKSVEISSELIGSKIRFFVTDSGPRIPDAVAERILEPFYTTKELGKGTGLGLSIAKGIIEMHGGEIYLDRACAKTRFVVELKALAVSAQTDRGI